MFEHDHQDLDLTPTDAKILGVVREIAGHQGLLTNETADVKDILQKILFRLEAAEADARHYQKRVLSSLWILPPMLIVLMVIAFKIL